MSSTNEKSNIGKYFAYAGLAGAAAYIVYALSRPLPSSSGSGQSGSGSGQTNQTSQGQTSQSNTGQSASGSGSGQVNQVPEVPGPTGCTLCSSGVYWCPNAVLPAAYQGMGGRPGALISTYRLPQYDPVNPNITLDGVGYYFRQGAESCTT